MEFKYDVIVIGAGHAGCEAAAAAANLGSKTCLITMDMNKIAQMSCNPAVGGIAKGQIVREIDALGGYMGLVTDKTAIQFRMLNRSKGPAMWSPRAQCDRGKFIWAWREILENIPNLHIWQDTVEELIIENGEVKGLTTCWGVTFYAKCIVLTAGTFLNGLMHIGRKMLAGGRCAEPASYHLTESITRHGITAGRMKSGTPVRIDKATVATGDFTYIPGVVTISAISGYSATETGSVKRLSAQITGDVYAKDNAALCYNGTWKIVEVTDFTAQLAGLVKKCELIIIKANPGKMGEATQEALDYLQNNVITPASYAVAAGAVTEQQYNAYVALYNQFQMMPRASLADALDTTVYYYIRNGYFTEKYAALNTNNDQVEPKAKGTGDNYLWSFVKNIDGTVYVYNKANGMCAYINSNANDQTVYVGRDYAWTLKETTTDTGNEGIAIVSGNGDSAWYTNPSSWGYVLTKPYTWGGSVWTFEKSNVKVETGIEDVECENDNVNTVYDLQGRKVEVPSKGIYIVNGNKILIK